MAVLQDININVHGQPSEKRLQTFLRLSQNENGPGTKPDGNVYSKTGTVTGNFVVIEEDIQMTAVAGVWDAKLDIINGTHNIMTALIRVVVDADVVDPDAIASDSQLQGLVAEAKYYAEHARTDAYGSPLTATTAAEMTDKTRVYVYTGSETGMTAGNWYYWNGSAWVSGGVYNAVAVQTDTTLSVAGKAADGKAAGDAIEELKEDLKTTTGYAIDGVFVIPSDYIEQGAISGTGEDAELATRIRTNLSVPIKKGSSFTFTAGTTVTQVYWYLYLENGTVQHASAWLNDGANVTFSASGVLRFMFCKTDASANIVPSDYDATVTVLTSNYDFLTTLKNGLKTTQSIEFVESSIKPLNLIKRGYLIPNQYINTDGTVKNSTGFYRTDYIEIEADEKYLASFNTVGLSAFYDANYVFISTVSTFNYAVTAPSNAKYLRCSIPVAYINNCFLILHR